MSPQCWWMIGMALITDNSARRLVSKIYELSASWLSHSNRNAHLLHTNDTFFRYLSRIFQTTYGCFCCCEMEVYSGKCQVRVSLKTSSDHHSARFIFFFCFFLDPVSIVSCIQEGYF